MIRRAAPIAAALTLLLSACTSAGDEPAAPIINATTERQEQIEASMSAVPTVALPETDETWGENRADEWIGSGAKGWRAFTPGAYDRNGRFDPTLMGVWILREPEGDDRNGTVFVTAVLRPHEFIDRRDETGLSWGSTMASAMIAVRANHDIAETDIAQYQPQQIGNYSAYLLTGYGEAGSNEGFNFAYVVFDEGEFFYEFRLAGDPDYFPDFQDAFLDFVSQISFDA